MADILIRGMEMPKDGYVYIEMLLKVADGKIYYNYTSEKKVYTADFLTLPEGHGRLGDLDALKENLRTVDFWDGSERVVSEQDINDIPTIVPAEGDGKDG